MHVPPISFRDQEESAAEQVNVHSSSSPIHPPLRASTPVSPASSSDTFDMCDFEQSFDVSTCSEQSFDTSTATASQDNIAEADDETTILVEHEAPSLVLNQNHTAPESEIKSSNAGYKLVFDNIDKTIKPRHMRQDSQTSTLHYVQAYAVRDRINIAQ